MLMIAAAGEGRRSERSAGRGVQFTAVRDFHLSPGQRCERSRKRGEKSSFPVGAHERNTKARGGPARLLPTTGNPRLSPPLHASPGLAAPGSAAFVLMPARFARGNEMILPRQTRRPSKPPHPVPTAAVGASDASCRRHRKQLERVVIQGEALLKNTFNEAS